MVQRTLIAACLIVTIASLSLVGLVCQQSNRAVSAAADATRRLAEAQAAHQAKMVELFAQSQATGAEMLKQLQTMAKPAGAPASQSADWIPVTFKLTLETVDGPPAVGYEVTLDTNLFERSLRRESDSHGLVDFGVVHPGDWEFTLAKALNDELTWRCRGRFNVLPGSKVMKAIVCPRPLPVETAVKLRVVWPADLARKDLRVEASFAVSPTTIQPPLKWTLGDSLEVASRRHILCGPESTLTEIGAATKLELWHFFSTLTSTGVQTVFGDFSSHAQPTRSDSVAMETGSFALGSLVVLLPCARRNAEIKGQRFRVVGHTQATAISAPDVFSYALDPDDGARPLGSGSYLGTFRGGVTVPASYWRQLDGRFVARGPGK